MKIWKKGLAVIGVSLLIAFIGVGIWQRENVQALWEGMSYDEEQLKSQMTASKEKVQAALEEYQIEGIRDLTVAEEEQLMKGELSVQEALDLIMNSDSQSEMSEDESVPVSNQGESAEEEATKAPTHEAASSNQPTTKQIVEKYVEQMYTLQATFLSELGAIEASAREVFANLPPEERNLNTAKKLAPSFINKGLALESSCDSQVNSLLNAFAAELKEVGASTTIVDNMREAYQTQKRLKKAYYLSAIK